MKDGAVVDQDSTLPDPAHGDEMGDEIVRYFWYSHLEVKGFQDIDPVSPCLSKFDL